LHASLSIAWGRARLRSLALNWAADQPVASSSAQIGTSTLNHTLRRDGNTVRLEFASDVIIHAGETLDCSVTMPA
jgi:hypothetical protein